MRPWLTLLLLIVTAAHAQDYAREQRWADEILPGLVVGQPLYLNLKNGHRFLSLYSEVPGAKTAIVLIHGVGVHPDHGLIGILRTRLTDLGYTTVAVQMPVQGKEAQLEDYYPTVFTEAQERIASVAQHLVTQGYQRLVLLSHSMGAWMSNCYLIDHPQHPFNAWISIGLTGRFWGVWRLWQLPVLDVFGENDLPPVLSAAWLRRAGQAFNSRAKQVMLPRADHHFTGQEKLLIDVIIKFLQQQKL